MKGKEGEWSGVMPFLLFVLFDKKMRGEELVGIAPSHFVQTYSFQQWNVLGPLPLFSRSLNIV